MPGCQDGVGWGRFTLRNPDWGSLGSKILEGGFTLVPGCTTPSTPTLGPDPRGSEEEPRLRSRWLPFIRETSYCNGPSPNTPVLYYSVGVRPPGGTSLRLWVERHW